MDEKRVLQMIHWIAEKAGRYSAESVLEQMREVLESDGASADILELVTRAAENIPETIEEVKKSPVLTREQLYMAKVRGDERRKREIEAARYGRC